MNAPLPDRHLPVGPFMPKEKPVDPTVVPLRPVEPIPFRRAA